ncbi:MAG: tRNA dihydrouridine synthase DusB, partial [Oscillospiraceae bacterium]|nr:tRNA dihydrouridine synthase DusB [Oscillospiraceae bacterium]
TELISSKAVCYGDRKTDRLATLHEDERPAAIQIFGHEPETMAKAAYLLQKFSPAYIDLNFGCPMPKLVNNGDGSAVMRDPALCGRIVKEVRNAIDVPVTVKIRKGDDDAHVNAVEVAKICEANGASAVFVHGRTRAQLYSGKADRALIGEVKRALSVPVIGNGDIDSVESAEDMYARTGCDGIMVGRGCYGAPWLFRALVCHAEGKPYTPPDNAEIRSVLYRQIRLLEEDRGPRALLEMRKHLSHYCRGKTGSARLRERINSVSTREELEELAELLFPDCPRVTGR